MRSWVKAHLPYGVVCAVARLVNRPWLEDLHRCERIVEYPWVLGWMAYHPPGTPVMDFGYAGGYLAEALAILTPDPVVGVDPRATPLIRHPNFRREWPLTSTGYGTILCVSVFEHYLPESTIADLWGRLVPGGQLLVTVPFSNLLQRFRGYRTITHTEVSRWPGAPQVWWYTRAGQSWYRRPGAGYLPRSTEYQVNAVACIRLTRPGGSPPVGGGVPATRDSAS